MRTKFLEIWNRFLMLLRREGLHGPIEWAGALFTVGLVGLIVWVKFATFETSHQKPLLEQKVRVVALASEANDPMVWQGRGVGGSTFFFVADAANHLSLGDQVCSQAPGGGRPGRLPRILRRGTQRINGGCGRLAMVCQTCRCWIDVPKLDCGGPERSYSMDYG